jgi:uncharacterized membrane protein YfcA
MEAYQYIFLFFFSLATALLTLYSGFGLGTLLTPFFAFYFPLDTCIALTAIVHLCNSVLKTTLTYRHINFEVVKRFGVASLVFAIIGAVALSLASAHIINFSFALFQHRFTTTYFKIAIGIILLFFVVFDRLIAINMNANNWKNPYFIGAMSGFFGGLTGNQGAFRSAYLIATMVDKNTIVATSAAVACMVDCSRLGVYSMRWQALAWDRSNTTALVVSLVGAIIGTLISIYYLKKMELNLMRNLTTLALIVFCIALILGVL